MSSKFARARPPRRPPSICRKPFGSCRPAFDIQYPPQLWAWIKWVDLDPLDPIHGAGHALLLSVPPANHYLGISAPNVVRVGCRLSPAAAANHWTIVSTLFYYAHAPADYHWGDHYVDPTQPFNTGLLQVTHIPGFDFHRVRITS